MDELLTIIGVLGLGALLIAAVVFASAAKRFVTGEDLLEDMEAMQSDLSPYKNWQNRASQDRRKNHDDNVFPMSVNGVVIEEDRRMRPDRRQMT